MGVELSKNIYGSLEKNTKININEGGSKDSNVCSTDDEEVRTCEKYKIEVNESKHGISRFHTRKKKQPPTIDVDGNTTLHKLRSIICSKYEIDRADIVQMRFPWMNGSLNGL